MTERPPYRLPETVLPRRYQVEIAPDLTSGHYSGKVSVDVAVLEPVPEFVLNADALTLEHAVLTGAGSSTAMEGTISYRPEEEQVVLTWPHPVAPGDWVLSFTYQGEMANDLRGFYRTTVTGPDGEPVVVASTQCEATDARRVFPCWDEPAFKARFAITLVVEPELAALSNGPEVSSELDGAGKRRVTFAETMPMSTYLVALAVGPFAFTQPVMVDNTPVRIVARPGLMHLTGVAEEAAPDTLRFFQGYFGIPYPGQKLDHIAIPDFAAGAMENLGLVTYRENALLADPERSSTTERFGIVSVIAHETAHMWFGDLVTMRWWNGLWLNEAFATFMSAVATDALHPEWDVWTTFGPGRAYALSVDGLETTRPIEFPVGRPAEASAMFDTLTYQKGGSVLRMLEQFLGSDVFRRGVSHYLMTHRYGNTETGDLWDALETISGQPVRAMMDSWIFQGGFPLVRAERQGTELVLTQQPFRYRGAGSGTWQVPLMLSIHHADGQPETVETILGQEPLRLPLPASSRVLVNRGGWGFYRVAYDPGLWEQLVPTIRTLTALERLVLVDDVWAAVLADQVPLSQAVSLWRTLESERDPDVWATVTRQLGLVDRMADDHGRSALASLVQAIGRPVLDELGWEPAAGEDVRRGRLRALMVDLLGTVGTDEGIRREAKHRLMAHLEGRAPVAPDLLNPIVAVVAAAGGQAEWDLFQRQYRDAKTPQDKPRYLYALAGFPDPALTEAAFRYYLSPEVLIQDGAYGLGAALRNRHASRVIWPLIEQHWDEILDKYPRTMMIGVVAPIAFITDDDLAERTTAWLDAHPVAEVAPQVAQAKEFQAIHRALAHRERGRLAQILRHS